MSLFAAEKLVVCRALRANCGWLSAALQCISAILSYLSSFSGLSAVLFNDYLRLNLNASWRHGWQILTKPVSFIGAQFAQSFFDAPAKELVDFSFNFQFIFDTEAWSVTVDFATGSIWR